VNDTVPGVARIVDDDVDLSVAKFCSLLDQIIDIFCLENVSGDSYSLAAILIDVISNSLGLFYSS
jgi:hypothetical protein